MEMLLCGRIRNGREGMGETLKDTVEVQTPGLAQAEMLQEMMEERLPGWGGAEAQTRHLSSSQGLWHSYSENEVPGLCTGRSCSRDELSGQMPDTRAETPRSVCGLHKMCCFN